MTQTQFAKQTLGSVAIFGASGHIGGPMARYLRYSAPQVKLRLISSSADKTDQLRREFPGVEVIQASYFDQASLDAAVAGMQGLFVITPLLLDERPAMTNLVAAVRKSGSLIHMIRQVAWIPDANPRRIPKVLRECASGLGLESQHPIARQVLDEAGMPVTYLNCGASFMDNYLRMAGMVQEGVLRWHNRRVPYLDPREVGEAAARLLLSDEARHLGQVYTLNNGEAGLRPSDAARMLSEMLGRSIAYDGTREGLFSYFQPIVDAGGVPAMLPEYLWNMFEYENANEHAWVPNVFLEGILGRKPNTLRAWLQEHLHRFQTEIDSEPSKWSKVGAATTTSEATSLDGIWDCTVTTPMGKKQQELMVRSVAAGKLEGEMRDNNGSIPLQEGKVDGNKLSWTMQVTQPIKITLTVEVQIDGNRFSGFAKASMLGKSAIEGTKRA
ncbi:hypothetical protein PTKU46_86080 [Paraburkholderia terrae]|uniref:NmrA family NAD(P)-binding protein n=1 Tax=Paraburkholderia terrae TaxID=311230 RepID=UPI0030E061BC